MMLLRLEKHQPELRGDNHFVADNARVIGQVVLEQDVSIWFNCVLRGDNDLIHIGAGSNIQDGSVLHTDGGIALRVGRRVTVGHMVMLHGCTIGDDSLIGIKSVILNRARIGKHCIIGANTLIAEGKEIPDRSLVMGSPGKIVRTLTDDEIIKIPKLSEHYIDNFKRYKKSLEAL